MSRRGGRDDPRSWHDEAPKPREPKALGDAVHDVARRLGLPDPATVTAVRRAWPEIVGSGIASHSHPRAVRDGVLTVAVDSAAWATQLRYLEGDIVTRLAASAAGAGVRGIRVVLDRTG